ncbi:MAG: TM2 domain-containing protein [Eubacteriales bacterium]|nr:TM2 domain-containing protein [Eubacteriales bacterium]MDD3883191.1 TM2 domain-containing protein [Eubacteriales bacterium]MDD4513338.1 TM2 domain-containing protein [Eubacteriales bacterium]
MKKIDYTTGKLLYYARKEMIYMTCPNCGANIYDDVNRCQYCGSYMPVKQSQIPPQQVVYQQPQQPVVVQVVAPQAAQDNAGHPYVQRVEASSKSKWVAFLLCLFLGYIGAHKFYVGKTGAGILYFFTVGIFGIGWIIDLLVILSDGFTDKWGRKLSM